MIYTEENFKNAKQNDIFDFVCPVCGKEFHKTKREINKNNGKIPKFCSQECYKQNKAKKYINAVCKECGKEYTIEKCIYDRKIREGSEFFCCQSCAAKHNNKKRANRESNGDVIYVNGKNKKNRCPKCGKYKYYLSTLCKECDTKERRKIGNFELGYYIGYEEKKTYLSHKCAEIRKDARRFMDNESKQEKVCAYCHNHEFDEILEVHHLKGILEFDAHMKISEINCDENLVWLCPNHHIMLEKGLITLEDKK